MRSPFISLSINLLLVLFLLGPLLIFAQQEAKVEELKVRDWVIAFTYEKNGEFIKRKDLIPLLQTVPQAEHHLNQAHKYNVIRTISIFGTGVGAAILLNSDELGGVSTGFIIGFTSALLTFYSHFDYQNQMTKAVKAFNKSKFTSSFIQLSPRGFVYHF